MKNDEKEKSTKTLLQSKYTDNDVKKKVFIIIRLLIIFKLKNFSQKI
jgi:hypothetical protein